MSKDCEEHGIPLWLFLMNQDPCDPEVVASVRFTEGFSNGSATSYFNRFIHREQPR